MLLGLTQGFGVERNAVVILGRWRRVAVKMQVVERGRPAVAETHGQECPSYGEDNLDRRTGMSVLRSEGEVAEGLVEGAVAAGGAGKYGDFVDKHHAAVEVGEFREFRGERGGFYVAAGAPEGEVRNEAAFFGAVAELE